jgi:hypothetical protein
LWQRIFESTAGTSGILTASDSGFFRELQFLIRSIRQVEDRPVCVIDLGLTEATTVVCRTSRRYCMEKAETLRTDASNISSALVAGMDQAILFSASHHLIVHCGLMPIVSFSVHLARSSKNLRNRLSSFAMEQALLH